MKTNWFVVVWSVLWFVCLPTSVVSAWERFEETERKMGTTVRVTCYAEDAAQARRGARAAFERADQLERILSDYLPESEVNRLSAASRGHAPNAPIPVSDDLWRVLARATEIARKTDGAFDVTVGPYVRLWRRARQLRQLPTDRRLAAARESVGYEKMQLDAERQTVQLQARDMRLDLGGIAKGYILDEMIATLGAAGIDRALVDGGGDLVASGPPPGRAGWTVVLSSGAAPTDRADAEIALVRAAVATSGDTFQYVEIAGVRYSHIIDPPTGLGLTRRLIVSAVARDGMTADAWASAISVLGTRAGLDLVDRQAGVSARTVELRSGKPLVHTSSGFPQQASFSARADTR